MKKSLYILIFLLVWFSAVSQPTDSINYDINSNVEIRTSENINDYLKDDYYKYDNEAAEATESIRQKFWSWVYKFFRFVESGGKPVSYAFYAILIVILIVAITKLLGIRYQSLFFKGSKVAKPDFEIFDEDIHGINFDKEINEAVKQENYRKAVRFLYIKFLKVLVDNELIEWEINKTNKDYRKEMNKTKFFSLFKYLTLVYEYVWYGEFEINKTQYNNYLKDYNKVFKNL